MSERRMFSRRIVKSDYYMDLPVSSRDLYFQLCMDADDDGFVSSPRMTMKVCGSVQADLAILASKRFIIVFDSGVVLIKHWLVHNELKRDRYRPTTHQDEKGVVRIKENRVYSLDEGVLLTEWRQVGNTLLPQDRIGKDRIGKVSKEDRAQYALDFDRFWSAYPRKVGKQDCKRWWDRHYFPTSEVTKMVEAIGKYRNTKQWQEGFIPHPTTFLNKGRWEDEIIEDGTQTTQAFKTYLK